MIKWFQEKLATQRYLAMRDIAMKRQKDSMIMTAPVWWVSIATPDQGLVVCVHACCKNHATVDAFLIAGFHHGDYMLFGPYAPGQIPEEKVGRIIFEEEARTMGGKDLGEVIAMSQKGAQPYGRPN